MNFARAPTCTIRQVEAKHSGSSRTSGLRGSRPTLERVELSGPLLDTPVFREKRRQDSGKIAVSRNEKNMKRALISTGMLLLALVAAHAAMAEPQTGSGSLSGVVIGPDDKPVPHALVTYQSAGGTAPHVAHADARGRFTISKLRSDNYELRASGKGVFSSWENVSVRSGKTKTLTLHTIYAKEVPKAYTATRTYEQNN